MFHKVFENLLSIFYPSICVNCQTQLFKREKFICSNCRHKLPIININNFQENEISDLFYGHTNIYKSVSLLYFKKKGITKNLIYELKYKNNQKVGSFLGNWLGDILKKSNEFNDIDFIIPVPLHKSKLKKRGYNQLTEFGKSMSTILDIEFKTNILQKVATTKTQTFKTRFERFSNNDTKFKLTDFEVFKNKHILLIDDVITTGATLKACYNELQKTENITISIASMAFTSKK